MCRAFSLFVVCLSFLFGGVSVAQPAQDDTHVVVFDKTNLTYSYYQAERLNSEAKDLVSTLQEFNNYDKIDKSERAERLLKRFDVQKIASGIIKDGKNTSIKQVTVEDWKKAKSIAQADFYYGYSRFYTTDESQVERNAALYNLGNNSKEMSALSITAKDGNQILFLVFPRSRNK